MQSHGRRLSHVTVGGRIGRERDAGYPDVTWGLPRGQSCASAAAPRGPIVRSPLGSSGARSAMGRVAALHPLSTFHQHRKHVKILGASLFAGQGGPYGCCFLGLSLEAQDRLWEHSPWNQMSFMCRQPQGQLVAGFHV